MDYQATVKLSIDRNDSRDYVALDKQLQWAICEALRYGYGRHTAATGDTAKWCLPLLLSFDTDVLQVIVRDVEEFLERRERFGIQSIEVYECDVAPFIKVMERCKTILADKEKK